MAQLLSGAGALPPTTPVRSATKILGVVLFAALAAIYLPDIGHGFVKDDFAWIRHARSADLYQAAALFSSSIGFYRPIVSLTFAADYAVWGLHPFGYAITNVLVLLVDAVLVYAIARRLRLPPAAALLATAVWVFNFHGINMALLWLSGRTALLLTTFGLATVLAFLNGSYLVAGALCFGAMLCKEEAIALPALVAGLALLRAQDRRPSALVREALRATWPMWIALVLYAILRAHSGAFDPTNAPSYYRFTFAPMSVLRNAAEYADRAGTVATLVALVVFFTCCLRVGRFLDVERRTLAFAGVFTLGTFAITVFLPVRSSLYAVMPSVGFALGAGAVASRALRERPERFGRVAVALVLVVIALVPIYRSRNRRWAGLADMSARAMATIEDAAAGRRGGHIVLIDDPAAPVMLSTTFDALFPDAVFLTLGPTWSGEIVTHDSRGPQENTLTFRLRNGALVQRGSR